MNFPDGVTLRQLQYWLAQGYLPAEGLLPGTGHQREWTPERVRMLTVMGELRLAGIEAQQAGQVAVFALEQEHGIIEFEVALGIVVHVDLDELLSLCLGGTVVSDRI